MALPTLTAEQRQAAQAKSREARQARSALLAGIKSGEETIPAVLEISKCRNSLFCLAEALDNSILIRMGRAR